MTEQLTTTPQPQKKRSPLNQLAETLEIEPAKLLSTLQKTVFAKANQEELIALIIVANTYGLNPLLKQMYAFPKKGGGIEAMVPIDGWLKIINDHEQFDGMDIAMAADGSECTVKIHRKDRTYPTVITEYLDECKRNTEPWNTMPKRMLRNKAIIQAGRVAFSIGGIHDEDEANDIGMRQVGSMKASSPGPAVQVNPMAVPESSQVINVDVESTDQG